MTSQPHRSGDERQRKQRGERRSGVVAGGCSEQRHGFGNAGEVREDQGAERHAGN